jgi:hypothetical protein
MLILIFYFSSQCSNIQQHPLTHSLLAVCVLTDRDVRTISIQQNGHVVILNTWYVIHGNVS